ncbi:PspC domain-containing protein [Altibacter sp. HG106]|uniref:PspC domain-containing protein n=1 Tax=Altibacter sp. HG106 TaxID=3023937 RepID=UPI00235086F7|nr:PspC domain-containing protein [Altibacter sp. HG106]MDC7993851.1 PspC domain-containing protein [Altibacter sp. HG106]
MNKTVNINLAGTFFHIDEDAYGKLSRYLDAIRKSLSDPHGSDEIMRDIEARIAELFSEKLESSTQVVTLKELDEVIAVMGQPEDYQVDEEIFDDTPPQAKRTQYSSNKKLYRDIDDKFISGVSSGLGHYLGIDALWIRLLWIVLVLAGFGSPILVYILLWILVPAAETTSEKLHMTGEAVNISNIEKKFKEGYENVADRVKNVDYDKYGKKVKRGASGFFETLGSILLVILKIFVKIIGVFLIIVSLSTLIGLVVGMFTLGSAGFWGMGELGAYISLVDTTNIPIWLVAVLLFFAIGIPFFVVFILGLKLLITNIKSIGTPAKIVLLLVWVLSLIGLGILGVRQATETAFDGEFVAEETLPIRSGDTLNITMRANDTYEYRVYRSGGLEIKRDDNGEKIIYSNDVRLIVRSTSDSTAKVVIEKRAEGSDYAAARSSAEAIDYTYDYQKGSLSLDGYFTTDFANKYRDQEVTVIVYLPEGAILYADENTYSFHRNDSYYRDILDNGMEEKYLLVQDEDLVCPDCPVSQENDWERDFNDDDGTPSGSYYQDENGNWQRRNNTNDVEDTESVEPALDTITQVIDSTEINS